MTRWIRRFLVTALAASLTTAGSVLAQDEPVTGDEPLGGDEDPGANATDEEVQESAEDYYAQPRESTPGPGVLVALAAIALALVAFKRQPRS